VLAAPPQNEAPTHTFRVQQVWNAQISPAPQLALVAQLSRLAHGVLPSTQKPVPSVVLAHTHDDPGPHAVKVLHVSPVQGTLVQALLVQTLEAHWLCISTAYLHLSLIRVCGWGKGGAETLDGGTEKGTHRNATSTAVVSITREIFRARLREGADVVDGRRDVKDQLDYLVADLL
jgi:hypothetical protein